METTTASEPSPEFEYDVFISYSSRDKVWVRGELLSRIERAGLKAFIDFRDFRRGAPSINEMQRGVEKSRKTLLVLTPDYVKSGWAELENIMSQTLDPANRDLRTIPLLKVDCKKPLRIAALTHIDFTDGADLDLAWRQLLIALGAAPAPPKARDSAAPSNSYLVPPILPTDDPDDFIGRRDILASLKAKLVGKTARALVYGAPGEGKTTLAKMFAHENREAFDLVVFQTCGQRKSFPNSLPRSP